MKPWVKMKDNVNAGIAEWLEVEGMSSWPVGFLVRFLEK